MREIGQPTDVIEIQVGNDDVANGARIETARFDLGDRGVALVEHRANQAHEESPQASTRVLHVGAAKARVDEHEPVSHLEKEAVTDKVLVAPPIEGQRAEPRFHMTAREMMNGDGHGRAVPLYTPRGLVMSSIRQPAEIKFKPELDALARKDEGTRPHGWKLSPKAVATYILGGKKPVDGVEITPKFIGDKALVEVAIATLVSDRALMLIGEPGTAKSWLSEHLCAAISGDSSLIVQGTAGTSEDHIKYSWNYALLLAEGPSDKALIPSPIFRAMEAGKFARFEEITRTPAEIQDALISLLSEKQVAVPELGRIASAERGFSIIATANTRDRGVNEMSAALKRRFNFVTIPVVSNLQQEISIVTKREAELRADYQVEPTPPEELVTLLVTMFQELRAGITKDRKTKVNTPSSVMSTAEAISVLFNSAILAQHFGSGEVTTRELARSLVGAVAKESADDLKSLREYCETVAKGRKGLWNSFHVEARRALRG